MNRAVPATQVEQSVARAKRFLEEALRGDTSSASPVLAAVKVEGFKAENSVNSQQANGEKKKRDGQDR